jgi:Protein of unknown function (DUF1559)
MPRRDDDEIDDDERPRRRSRDDEDEDRPARSRRRRDDDEVEDRPRRRRDDEDNDRPPPRKKKGGKGLLIGLSIGAAVLLLCCGGGGYIAYKAVGRVRDAGEKVTASNNLRQIGVAAHQHMDRTGELPKNTYSPDGRPLLSWRVQLLPHLGQQQLYNQFRQDEPWDGPNNRRLLSKMPPVFGTPDEYLERKPIGTTTYYRGFSHAGAVFARRDPSRGGLRPGDFTDGMTNTILVVEAGDPVEWTKPDDLDATPGKPFPKLGGVRPQSDVVLVLMVDGIVKPMKKTMPEATWRALTTYAGNEAVAPD